MIYVKRKWMPTISFFTTTTKRKEETTSQRPKHSCTSELWKRFENKIRNRQNFFESTEYLVVILVPQPDYMQCTKCKRTKGLRGQGASICHILSNTIQYSPPNCYYLLLLTDADGLPKNFVWQNKLSRKRHIHTHTPSTEVKLKYANEQNLRLLVVRDHVHTLFAHSLFKLFTPNPKLEEKKRNEINFGPLPLPQRRSKRIVSNSN